MKTRLTLIFAALFTIGCHQSDTPVVEEVSVTPSVRLEGLIEENGEVTFYGWNGMEYNGGAHFRLTFQKERKVKLDTLGYNFVFAHGSFRFDGDSLVDITFDRIDAPPDNVPGYRDDWPLLRLLDLDGHLRIHREDGETAWHLDWPLYPEITENLWPLSASTKNAEQDADDCLPATSRKRYEPFNLNPEVGAHCLQAVTSLRRWAQNQGFSMIVAWRTLSG